MIRFKEKDYEPRELFARDEAKLLKCGKAITNDDPEVQVDGAIKLLVLCYGMDEGDLNGTKLSELLSMVRQATEEAKKRQEAEGNGKGTEA